MDISCGCIWTPSVSDYTPVSNETGHQSLDSSTDALLVVADKECQPLAIIDASLGGIILLEAVVQKLDVFGRGM
jgi:hypothetical protein